MEAHQALTAGKALLVRRVTVTGLATLLSLAGHAAWADDGPDADAGECHVQNFCVGIEDRQSTSPSGEKAPATSGKSNVQCRVTKMKPQPPAGHAIWKGESSKKGAIYFRACNVGNKSGEDGFIFVPDGEDAPGADPEAAVRQAVDEMALRGPRIAMSPKAGATGVLGMPVWMAVDESSKDRFGPTAASASAGGVTVEATARVSRVVWEMGDGAVKSCTPAQMKPYKKAYGLRDSACGHRYRTLPEDADEGRGTYTVAATAHWTVQWQVTGGGESGELGETRTTNRAVDIAEAQVLN